MKDIITVSAPDDDGLVWTRFNGLKGLSGAVSSHVNRLTGQAMLEAQERIDAHIELQNVVFKDRTDKAYSERMMAVRMLAILSGCVYGLGKDDNEAWEDEWRNVVYIDLPQGQVSWHIAPHDMHLFADFSQYDGKWDGKFNGGNADFVKGIKP